MKSWRLHEQGKLTLDELPIQSVGEGCVKIKLLAGGIGVTDVQMFEGKLTPPTLPLIIGRQCVALVTETGENVTGLSRGDRVAADPYMCCKTCAPCKAGKGDECEKMLCYGVDDNGFMSDFSVVPANALYVLPERIKDNDAVFMEHIALSINAVSKLGLDKGEHIVIVGADALGIILAQVALYYQAIPILVDTDEAMLRLAEELGVYYTVNSVTSDPMKKIFAVTGGKMAETVAYITTARMAFGRCLEYAAHNGRVALVGCTDSGGEIGGGLSVIRRRQLQLIGVNNGARLFPAAINLLATNAVDVHRLVSCEVPFSDVAESVRAHAEHGAQFIKAVVKP